MLKFILAYLAIGLLTSVIYIIFGQIYITIRTTKNYFTKDEIKKDYNDLNYFEKALVKIICIVSCFFVCVFESFKYMDYILVKNVVIWPVLVFIMFNKEFLNNYLTEKENDGL